MVIGMRDYPEATFAGENQVIQHELCGPREREKSSLVFKRSFCVVKDRQGGCVLTPESVRSKRPKLVLAPKYTYHVLCKKAESDVSRVMLYGCVRNH